MIYKMPNGKVLKIDDKSIQNLMKYLDLTEEEAIRTYLEDEGEFDNIEQITLDEKAKEVGCIDTKSARKKIAPHTRNRKTSDEKQAVFNSVLTNLNRCEGVEDENIKVLKKNKLIQVEINGTIIKIDFVQQREPKN